MPPSTKNSDLKDVIQTRFEGNLLINTRTITNTSHLFQSITGVGKKRKTIRVSELCELLVLLESISTSKNLHYDATVPNSVLDLVQNEEDILEKRIGDTNVFEGIRPNTERQTLALCKSGIQQSSALLRGRIKTFSAPLKGMPSTLKDIRRLAEKPALAFANELRKPLPSIDERDEYAIDLIKRNPFNGAKCVAGILTTEPSDDPLLGASTHIDIRSLCRAVLYGRSDNDICWIVPMMINSFRSNFLGTLAAEHGNAAVFAGPDMERVIDQQIFLLSNYVAGQLSATKLAPHIMKSQLGKHFHSTNQFPFVGLLTLLSAEDGDPYSVFRTSLTDKDQLLAKFASEKSNTNRYIHDFNATQLNSFKNDKLHHIYQRHERRLNFYKAIERVNHKFLQPAISWYPHIKPFINELLSHNDVSFRLRSIVSGAGEATAYSMNKILMPGEHLRYATFTHQIRRNINLILKNRGHQSIIEERVSKVLGCELVVG